MIIPPKRKIALIIFLFLLFINSTLIDAAEPLGEETPIEMSFRDADLRDVLRLISELAGVNLITDSSVSGVFTAHLTDITFIEALEFITFANDLGFYKSRNTYIVAAPSRLERFLEQPVSQIFYLDYAEPGDLQGVVAATFPDAEIEINERLNALIVKTHQQKLDNVAAFIKELDTPKALISVEVRIEEISSSRLKELGVGPGELANIKFFTGEDNTTFEGIGLDLPSILRVLEEEGASTNLANPRLTTIDGIEGRMLIGDRIPVKTEEVVDGQVVSTINYIEVGIAISFLPRVSSDDYITLRVRPEISSIGEGATEGFPHIRTREAETVIRIKSGETFAIGGLIQDRERTSMARVPILSELPILGELFKRKTTDISGTELIIFITPQIIKDAVDEKISSQNSQRLQYLSYDALDIPTYEDLPPHLIDWIKKYYWGLEDEAKEEDSVEDTTSTTAPAFYLESISGNKKVLNDFAKVATTDYILAYSPFSEQDVNQALTYYEVVANDTLWAIGRAFNIDYQLIMDFNKIDDPTNLKIGQRLIIPLSHSKSYTVQRGDTLASIAEKFDLEIKQLILINDFSSTFFLKVGQSIIIPQK